MKKRGFIIGIMCWAVLIFFCTTNLGVLLGLFAIFGVLALVAIVAIVTSDENPGFSDFSDPAYVVAHSLVIMYFSIAIYMVVKGIIILQRGGSYTWLFFGISMFAFAAVWGVSFMTYNAEMG